MILDLVLFHVVMFTCPLIYTICYLGSGDVNKAETHESVDYYLITMLLRLYKLFIQIFN